MSQEAGYTPLTRAQLSESRRRLAKYYGAFFVFLITFTVLLYLFERAGLPHRFIGYALILLTLALYAFIGILNFTRRLEEYYIAGRRVPAIFNGMATGADWMSAASFISMAGTMWLLGYDALAYIMGWTG